MWPGQWALRCYLMSASMANEDLAKRVKVGLEFGVNNIVHL